jgi:hypothetical protein
MGRTIIAALIAMGMLTGCTDWREGEETVEACEKRFALKKGAVHPLADDPGQWVASFTYDITKLGGEGIRALVKTAKDGAEPGTVGLSVVGSGSSQIVRDKFADLPATEAGAVLMADDPSLYKVRGKHGLHSDLVRQGCEGQRAGMRLISWQAAREDALVDGDLPKLPMSVAQLREFQNKFEKPLIKDILR